MKTLLALCVVLLAPVSARAAFDGLDIQTDFCPGGLGGCAYLAQVQNNHTGFGDTYPASGGFTAGSEMDALYLFKTADSLAINITGNLEVNSGNAWVVFLDTKPGGVNPAGITNGPGSVKGQMGNTFPAGFEPDYALAVNVSGANVYVDLVDLQTDANKYLGYVPVGTAAVLTGGTNPNNTSAGFSNLNNVGVTDINTKTAAENQADAATALKGMEMLLNLNDIGTSSASLASLKVLADLSGSSGYLSNQFLPGIGGTTQSGNLGFGPLVLADKGVQTVTVNLPAVQTPLGPQDGDNIPQDSGSANLVATQNNYTGFGNGSGTGTPASDGSELDALFISNTPSALEMGITGNLEPNQNFLMVFLDTGPGVVAETGISTPVGAGPLGVLEKLNGVGFDAGFSPTHVLLINSGREEGVPYAYVDIYDLRTNIDRYLGKVAVGGGSGVLTGGDNPNGALVAFGDSNIVGVTDNNNKTASENETDAKTASAGFELSLPFRDIGLSRTQIRYMAALVGPSGYWSNQFLPGLGGGYGNLGNPTLPVNFSTIAGLQYGTYTVTGLTYSPYASLTALKAEPDGVPAEVTAKVSATFCDRSEIYIQDSLFSNPSGVLVIEAPCASLSVGQSVTVKGFISRAHGERAIVPVEVIGGAGGGALKPIYLGTKALGGGDLGATPGVTGALGLNNVGLLVRTGGKVSTDVQLDITTGGYYFYLDDGANLNDGNESAFLGVRVDLPVSAGVFPAKDSWVKLTGISSLMQTNGTRQRRLLPRDDNDINAP